MQFLVLLAAGASLVAGAFVDNPDGTVYCTNGYIGDDTTCQDNKLKPYCCMKTYAFPYTVESKPAHKSQGAAGCPYGGEVYCL